MPRSLTWLGASLIAACVASVLPGAAGATAPPPPPPAPPVDSEPEPEPEPEPKPEPPPPAEGKSTSEPAAQRHDEVASEVDESDDTPAVRDEATTKSEPRRPFRSKYLTISGYVQPQYTYRVRQNARPRDQREFGAGATRAGIIFSGEPLDRWTYTIHLVIGAQLVNNIWRVDAVDRDGDGFIDDIATRSELAPGIFMEELSVDYRPVDYALGDRTLVTLDLKLGQLRIPFTAANRSPNAALMFPRRSAPNNVFLFGTDLGGLATMGIYENRVEVSGGVFNGTGLAIGEGTEDTGAQPIALRRGALYAARVDLNPLGGFPFAEGDLGRGPFRFGVGGGLLYFPSRLFDEAGNDTRTRARDLRASASVRLAVRGLYLQGEFLRRQQTDSLSSLPFLATGAYGQGSFFFPVYKNLGMAPVGRFGWTRLDESFDPRNTHYAEGGLALYLGNDERPDVMRFLLQYLGEWRIDEDESAQGAALQVQLTF
jgi:hypothetical protein